MTVYYVIPCAGAKADAPAPARDLYRGTFFQHVLAAAEAEAAATERDLDVAARVLILSAKHGLLDLDTVVEPYEVKMGERGSVDYITIAGQLIARGIDAWRTGDHDEVYAMLPAAYLDRLDAAGDVIDLPVQNVYEAAPGIGYMRGVNANIARHAS